MIRVLSMIYRPYDPSWCYSRINPDLSEFTSRARIAQIVLKPFWSRSLGRSSTFQLQVLVCPCTIQPWFNRPLTPSAFLLMIFIKSQVWLGLVLLSDSLCVTAFRLPSKARDQSGAFMSLTIHDLVWELYLGADLEQSSSPFIRWISSLNSKAAVMFHRLQECWPQRHVPIDSLPSKTTSGLQEAGSFSLSRNLLSDVAVPLLLCFSWPTSIEMSMVKHH